MANTELKPLTKQQQIAIVVFVVAVVAAVLVWYFFQDQLVPDEGAREIDHLLDAPARERADSVSDEALEALEESLAPPSAERVVDIPQGILDQLTVPQ